MRICVCVDDLGLHGGVNAAALRLIALERVHAVAVLVGGPAWPLPAQERNQLNASGVEVGLHLDLTEFSLLPGSRRQLGELIASSYGRWLRRSQVRREIRAQLDAFEASLGRSPDFIDGHQHVHQLPGIREELLAELAQRYTHHRPWIRSTRRPRGAKAAHGATGGFKAAVIEWLGARRLSTLARQQGFRQNTSLLGIYDFRGGEVRYRNLLQGWLRCASDGDLLITHAGLPAGEADSLSEARQNEFRVLAEDAFGRALADLGITLAPAATILQPLA